MAAAENKGVFSKLGDVFNGFLELPESLPKKITDDPIVQHDLTLVLRIIYSLGVIALGVGLMAMTLHGFTTDFSSFFTSSGWQPALHAIQNPSWSVLAASPTATMAVALGTTWLLKAILGYDNEGRQRNIAKTMKVVAPIFLLGGGLAMMGFAFALHGGTLLGINYYFWAGLLMVGLAPIMYAGFKKQADLNERRARNCPIEGKRNTPSEQRTTWWQDRQRRREGFATNGLRGTAGYNQAGGIF